jgi:hypothetical protein
MRLSINRPYYTYFWISQTCNFTVKDGVRHLMSFVTKMDMDTFKHA